MSLESNKRYISNILFWLLFSICSNVILVYLGATTKQTVFFCVLSIFAIIVNVFKSKDNPNYIKDVFCITKKSGRTYEYDHLRFFAVALVIITHAVQINNANGVFEGEHQIYVYTCIYILALSCNLIYVMLSGALLLPFKSESLSDFYLKRLAKVIFPMAVYYMWYIWQSHILHEVTFLGELYKFYTGTITISPHYWLLLIILGLYIVYPFIRYMLKDMPYKMITAIVVISLIFMGITVFSKEACYITCFFADWIGVAIIGYWMVRPETRKLYPAITVLGLLSGVSICIIIKNIDDFLKMVTNCSPLMTLFTMGIVSTVLMCKKVFSKGNFVLRLLSKYSYSIILVHWWSLNWVTFAHFNIKTNWLGYTGIFIALIVTIIVSLGAALIVDNLMLVLVTSLWDKVLLVTKTKRREG